MLDVLVSGEDDCEVRRVSLVNRSRAPPREIEVTSYAELVLTTPAADAAHPAFAKLFVQTEYLAEYRRADRDAPRRARRTSRRSGPRISPSWKARRSASSSTRPTARASSAAAGRPPRLTPSPSERPLSNTVGTVLDPIFSLRRRVRIAPGGVARIAFWTVVGTDSRAELIDLVDMHHDRSAFDRARTLAWTQAQVQLRHLDIDAEEAADFQRLAAPIFYADPRFRPSPGVDPPRCRPAVGALAARRSRATCRSCCCASTTSTTCAQVRQLLRAHEYWRMKRLAVDLVILNEHPSSYIQDLQTAIETAVRSSQSRPRFGRRAGAGHGASSCAPT